MIMDLSGLKPLGEIAGIGGIALGVTALVLRDLIGKIAGVPQKDRARVVTFVAGGCFVIGALGIAAWAFGNQPHPSAATTAGEQSPAIVNGGNAQVNYGSTPAPTGPAAPPAAAPNGSAHTTGTQSPAIVSGGNASVQSAAPPTATDKK
jgi:hypothetical protein